MFELRDYQKQAIDSAYDYLCHEPGNPVICSPTGSGKSLLVAELSRRAIEDYQGRVIVLQHRKELIQQNAAKLQALMPDLNIGIYSAGLKSRDTEPTVVFAGIQSVYDKAHLFAPRQLVIVDEVHLVPSEGEGMYRTFFSDMDKMNRYRVIGLTATPYRTGEGSICRKDGLFSKIAFDIPVSLLIKQGYLCPVTNRAADGTRDTSKLHKRAGEFITTEVDDLFRGMLEQACEEIRVKTADRHSVMVFCTSVAHAQSVCDLLPGAMMVEGNTLDLERASILRNFADMKLKYLVNVDVLTTGFDAPCVDAIAILRATASPGLFAQIVGRGLRTHSSKTECLVLDFGENLKRHGPIDRIEYNTRAEKSARGMDPDAPTKVCPACEQDVAIQTRVCECGFAWQSEKVRHETTADESSQIISEPVYFEVKEAWCSKHEKEGKTASMRVSYACHRDGDDQLGESISEWICFEHQGLPRRKAVEWWKAHSAIDVPSEVDDAVDWFKKGYCAVPKSITAIQEGKWWKIIEREIEEVPDPVSLMGVDEVPF
jgi:DNA repair protein RadD